MEQPKLDQRVQLVASREFIATIDQWRRAQPSLPSRSEAIRRLTELGLAVAARPPAKRAGKRKAAG